MKTLKSLYQELADLTEPWCAKCDMGRTRCCSGKACDVAQMFAYERYDVELVPWDKYARIPFLGPSGCVVAPHLRPHCARYVCCTSCMDAESRLKRALLMQQIKEIEEREGGIRVEEVMYWR